MIFAGKNAATELDRIRPHNVVKKCAPDAILFVTGSDKAKKVKGAEKSASVATENESDAVENLEAWGDWRTEALDDTPGVFSVNVDSM